jgi:rhodanese-related sulfurtransferase
MKEITVEELKKKKDIDENFVLLDVREPHEYYMSDIEGTTRIPLGDLNSKLDELNKNDQIIVLCRSGSRSAKATGLLTENGFSDAANLKGGINEWAKKIDPSLPEY